MFNTTIDCRHREEFPFCNEITGLIPVEGYWHSTPYSPLMRRCPVKEACSSVHRTEKLLEYYNDYNTICPETNAIELPKRGASRH